MKKNILFVLIAFILVELFYGCAPSKQIEQERIISPDRLVKKMEANRRKVKTFRGTGFISVFTPEVNAKSSFEVIVKRPDSVKISLFGPFGVDLAQILVTSGEYNFYDVINNNLYKGRVRPGVIKQILKVDLSLDEIVDALTGSVNMTEKLRTEPDNFAFENDFYSMAFRDSSSSIEKVYSVRNSDLAITNYVIRKLDGTPVLLNNYSGFRTVEEIPIPFKIEIDDKANKQKMSLEYKNVEVNKNNYTLKLDIPNDVKITEW